MKITKEQIIKIISNEIKDEEILSRIDNLISIYEQGYDEGVNNKPYIIPIPNNPVTGPYSIGPVTCNSHWHRES